MRIVVSLLTAVCFNRCCRGQCNWRGYAAVSGCAFGTEAQHHRPDQAPVASGREARWGHVPNPVPVDWRSAILQHVLLLT